VVVDGESVWLYDAAHGHWVYAEGTRATTYATDETPRSDPEPHPAAARTPTRVVPAEAIEETPRAEQPGRPTPPAEAPPTRGVSPEGDGESARDEEAAGSGEAPPTRVVGAEPTRIVPPEGDVP
jgi:hypothetical protein